MNRPTIAGKSQVQYTRVKLLIEYWAEYDGMMHENPYASPQTDVGAAPEFARRESVVLVTPDNPYLHPLFLCRKYAMQAMGLFLLFIPFGMQVLNATIPIRNSLGLPLGLLRGLIFSCEMLGVAALIAFVLMAVCCWLFLFLAAHHHAGLVYALSHLLAAVCLTPVLLTGIVLVPILVRGDIERAADGRRDLVDPDAM
jgi:hypothetical protein